MIRSTCLLLLLSCLNTGFYKAHSQRSFCLISYNVLNGFEQDERKMDEFTKWVSERNVDMIGFQELTRFTQESLEKFAREYGHPYAVLLKDEGVPVGITSKHPITNIRKVVDNMFQGFIYARVKDYHVFVVHLTPAPKGYSKRMDEVKLLLAEAALIPENEKIILMGDFNAFAPEDYSLYATHEKSVENFDYEVIRSIQIAGYRDAFRIKQNDIVHSYPTLSFEDQKPNRHSRLDYIWLNKPLQKKCLNSSIIKDSFTDHLSDHYPVFVELIEN